MLDEIPPKMTMNVSKSTINQDLDNVDDGSLKVGSEQNLDEVNKEENKIRNIDKLLMMAEQRIAQELQ